MEIKYLFPYVNIHCTVLWLYSEIQCVTVALFALLLQNKLAACQIFFPRLSQRSADDPRPCLCLIEHNEQLIRGAEELQQQQQHDKQTGRTEVWCLIAGRDGRKQRFTRFTGKHKSLVITSRKVGDESWTSSGFFLELTCGKLKRFWTLCQNFAFRDTEQMNVVRWRELFYAKPL